MKSHRVLYEIKTLEKLVFRSLTNDYKKELNCTITPTQIEIIKYMIENSSKDIYQRDLEKLLNLRRATVSGVLHTMEKNNLIERVTWKSDARIKRIILKDNAVKLYKQAEEKLEELESVIVQNITDEELENFSNIINRMKENISELPYIKKGE